LPIALAMSQLNEQNRIAERPGHWG
jgi:hypothetical protein